MDDQARPSTPQLVRSIAEDSSALIRKEFELARQEILEAVGARVKGAAAFVVAAVIGMMAVGFAAAAIAAAVEPRAGTWQARLMVAGGLLVIAMAAALAGLSRIRSRPMAPRQTKQTVKEDIQWAKAQLKR